MAVQYATATIDPPKPLALVHLGGAAKKWPAAEVPKLLAAICQQVLQRPPDALVEASFSEPLQTGTATVRDVVLSLALSDLYTEKFGAVGNPPDGVAHAYRRVLCREMDPAGRTWIATCQRHGLAAVLRGLATSAEYVKRFGNDKVPFPPPTGTKTESLFTSIVKTAVKIGGAAIARKIGKR